MEPEFFTQKSITADLDSMLEIPTRGTHRRTQSETFFRFPDFEDDMLNDVVSDFNLHFSDTNMQNQLQNNQNQDNLEIPFKGNEEFRSQFSHCRSLSVDADFFAGLNSSIDSGSSFEAVDSSKKAMAPEKLAQLAISDPQKAKRILANRQSAARSKERKVRYTGELERKVQTLQAEATTLSTQVTQMQRDTTDLTIANKELRLRLEALEQQSHLRDALNEALKEELKHLKIVAGEVQVVNGKGSLYYNQTHAINSFRGSQPQYTQQQKQQQPNFQGFII